MRTIKYLILGILGILILNSCKKEFSSDLPLDQPLTASIFVINGNNKVLAVDPMTGNKKWETRVENNVVATPTIINGKLVVIDVSGMLYSIDRSSGKVEFKTTLGGAVTGSPVVIADTLIIPVGNQVKAYRVSTDYSSLWQYDAGTPVTTSLATNTIDTGKKKKIFFATANSVGALNDSDGTIDWLQTVAGAGNFNSSVCAANKNYLYIGNDNGKLYALNSSDGSTFWSYQTGSAIKSSPISVGGNIMVGSNDRNFYSVDSATGLLRWKTVTGDRVLSSPFVYNQNVYFGSNDFYLYTINIIDGTFRWKNLGFGATITSPIAFDGTVFYNSEDKNIYALDAETGKQKWVYNTGGAMVSSMIYDNISEIIYPSVSGVSPL